ncbi:MAG TPA: CocE/NonD family hydrolase [Reyranella sp.]|jgi:dienelactone hydrolase
MKTILTALLCLLALPALSQSPGPQGPEGSRMREQEWRIPRPGVLMDATVFRPSGNAKAPLMVMNHGSPAASSERPGMKRPTYTAVSSFFVARGYVVVLPLRRGYGATGGHWAEEYGRCNNPDYFDAGLRTAADIRAAIDYMRGQSFVAPNRTVVVGQSAGGWGTLALSSLNPPGVPAMIDFAGGRGGHQPGVGNCEPSALVKAAAKYGSTARVPLLWINSANDTFFEPNLVNRMVEAYTKVGGQAVHRPVAALGKEGHSLASSDSGAPIWRPLVTEFLQGK